MISIADARGYVFSLLHPLDPEQVALGNALFCTAAQTIIASEPIPGFRNSSMDGFALRASDTSSRSVQLKVVENVHAGDVARSALAPGEAMRIMTGAAMPHGADCVEIVEEATLNNDATVVTVHRKIDAGAYVRHPGEDIEVGEELIAVGDLLNPPRIGVLASQGVESTLVRRQPRVGVLSTGNEVTSMGGTLAPGAIRDVNRPMVLALLGEAGMMGIDLGVVRDDYGEICRTISHAASTCDAVVTTGGVSAGDVDFVKVALGELAPSSARSMQVAMRPGKPFAFAVLGERQVPVFGLPGNPVSTRVSFEFFVRPALLHIAGRDHDARPHTSAILDIELARTPDDKTHLVHVNCAVGSDGRVHVIRAMRQGSHLLHAIARANAIAIVPNGNGLKSGESVQVLILEPRSLFDHQETL